MNQRKFDNSQKMYRYGLPLVIGTVANTISTLVTLPFQYIFTQKQIHPGKSYPGLSSYAFSLSGLREIYQQSSTAIRMAPKQSFAYLGVGAAAMEVFREDTSIVRGIKAGLISGVAESLFTAKDLQKMISSWDHARNENVDKRLIFQRSLQGTMLKNFVANPVTLAAYSYSHHFLKEKTQSNSPLISAFSGVLSAIFAAPIIAPFSTLQTRIQNDPTLSLSQHAKKISNESYAIFWKGGAARGVYKAIDSMIKFGLMTTAMRAFQKNETEKNPPVQEFKRLSKV